MPDVLLLIEVADTSLERDRGVKVAIYAAAGIPARLWVASAPRGSKYAELLELGRSDSTRRLPSRAFRISTCRFTDAARNVGAPAIATVTTGPQRPREPPRPPGPGARQPP